MRGGAWSDSELDDSCSGERLRFRRGVRLSLSLERTFSLVSPERSFSLGAEREDVPMRSNVGGTLEEVAGDGGTEARGASSCMICCLKASSRARISSRIAARSARASSRCWRRSSSRRFWKAWKAGSAKTLGVDVVETTGGAAGGMLLTAEVEAGMSNSTGEFRAVDVSGFAGGGIISLKRRFKEMSIISLSGKRVVPIYIKVARGCRGRS